MNRRNFIHQLGAAAVVASAPWAVARAVAGNRAEPVFQVLRLDTASGAWLPLACTGSCAAERMSVRFAAADSTALDAFATLRVHALHARGDGGHNAHMVWSRSADDHAGHSSGVRIDARRTAMQALRVEYRIAGETALRVEQCALTGFGQDGLQPGRYLLLGPDGAGRRSAATAATVRSRGVIELDVEVLA